AGRVGLGREAGLADVPGLGEVNGFGLDPSSLELREEDSVETLLATACLLQLNPVVKACCQFLNQDVQSLRKATVGHMLAVGGMDANKGATSIDAFSLRDNAWKPIATMSGRRLQFGAAIVDKKLIVAGGRDGLKTLSFDFSTLTWNTLSPMNVHRHGLGVAVLGGLLYAVGGHDGWSFLDTVERWDPSTRQWSSVSPMSIQRSTVGVTVLNDKLYAVGGRDIATNPNASRFNCVERYDPKTDTWTMIAPMSVPREAVGVCVLGDRLMAVGGYDGQQYLTLVEAYDPHLNEWEPVAPSKAGRAGSPCVVVKNVPGFGFD
ncbi:Kelch-like protein 5, partial [Dufourea novaeangliae]